MITAYLDHDAAGNKATFTSPENKTYTYGYNKNNQPTSIVFGGKTVSLEYLWNRQTKQTLPGSITTDFGYNDNGWLSGIETKKSGTPLTSSSYLFDKVGNITNKTTDTEPTSYDYDKTYQLINATKPQGPETFNYDKTGNRTLSGYSHNANNELLTADGAEYTYDANGNTVTKTEGYDTTIYSYDAGDRLAQVTLPDNRIATYSYDPFGRRIRKTVTLAGGSTAEVTYYVYADEGLIGEYDATGNQKKGYGWLPNGIWGTNPVFMTQGANTYYYQNDHLGTPQKMFDEQGNIVWQASCQAYGKAAVDASSTVESNLRFPGQYFDQETELHYNWNRYYDAGTGRYTQKDPIGFNGGINLYAYVQNNPIIVFDPYGLEAKRMLKRDKFVIVDDSDPEYQRVKATTPGNITNNAKLNIKTKYKRGGETPKSGFDCSGFTKYVANKEGFELIHSAKGQHQFFENNEMLFSKPQVGDVFFYKDSNGVVGHAGFVSAVDGDKVKIIHAVTVDEHNVEQRRVVMSEEINVKTDRYYKNHIAGYGRFVE